MVREVDVPEDVRLRVQAVAVLVHGEVARHAGPLGSDSIARLGQADLAPDTDPRAWQAPKLFEHTRGNCYRYGAGF